MELRTMVGLTDRKNPIRHSDSVFLLGSCFADGMGQRLSRGGMRCTVNPFGTLYNPLSIASVLNRMLDGQPFVPSDVRLFDGEGWGTWWHHSLLSRPSAAEALATVNDSLRTASAALRGADVLLLTFGTAWVYRLREGGEVVANCHRQPDRLFLRERLTVGGLMAVWQPLLERLGRECPQLRIVFTVSPIRHLRDGAHGNQLSKATLLLFVDELLSATAGSKAPCEEWTSYFPAYEIVLDELRDYRFYADDMVHPSSLAVDYVWERFAASCLDASARQLMARWEEVQRALEHRPFRPQSDEYKAFLRQTLLKIEAIQKEFPYFDAEKEIDQCHTLLNN